MKILKSFHNRVIRHVARKHACKKGDTWERPNHDGLLKESKVLPIAKCIERRRGALRKCLSKHTKDFLKEAEKQEATVVTLAKSCGRIKLA